MSLWTPQTNPNAYPTPPLPPSPLTPDLCLSSQSSIRDFLSMSRHATDDVLKQRLNSRFNDERHKSNEEVCKLVMEEYSAVWNQRQDVIKYCALQSKQYRSELQQSNREKPMNISNEELRNNPYALKDLHDEQDRKFAKLERLEHWISNEGSVEAIVQQRSLQVFKRACPGCF